MATPNETEEQRRRRLQQTRFGVGGEASRQKRLYSGEPTLGGGLYLPPSSAPTERREAPPQRLNPPGPRVTEYGQGGREGPAPAPVPQPARVAPTYQPQQTIGERPQVAEPSPAEFTVRAIPLDITRAWHVPAGITLREGQWAAIRSFHEHHKGRVVYPTGVGKTEIAIAAINDLRIPTVVILPTLILVDQWRARLAQWGIQAGVWTGTQKEPSYVTLSTYQSLFADPTLIRRFPFIVFDEAHRATADEFRKLIYESSQHPYALALTATDPPDTARLDILNHYLPRIAVQTTAEAIERGELTPVQVRDVATPLDGPERREYDRLTSILTFNSKKLGTGNPRRVQALIGSVQYHDAAIAFLRALSGRRLLLSKVKSKEGALLRIVQQHPRERVLLFSESVPAIETMCEFLRRNGIGCHTITGGTDERQRRTLLENWGRTYWVLGSVHVLQLGFDVPEVGIAVFVASGTGKLQLTQRIGRILRLAPGKTQAMAYVLYAPDTSEVRVVQKLQRLAGREVTVETPRGLEEYDEEE
ncbi:MAG TPA: DEAD/DEAH box helicase [Thermoplasmata archaeon]|nr:DEAD/DEAH box helicase [Thermoplasmata archaeon]HTW76889.1 DEAD/DEAH box helicase [Thermoplasmata archaeon]